MPAYRTVAIVGVGLIGGSIGLALRQRKLAGSVIGIGRRQTSLDKAIACGAIDHSTTDFESGVAGADIVIVATPVDSVADDVCRATAIVDEAALVTDVGSTKGAICSAVESSPTAVAERFVGSHPLAGNHRSGPEHATADLLEGKTVVVTPTPKTPGPTTERIAQFWEALGAQVQRMSPEQHDQALAVTSHLPHLVASALAACTPPEWLPLAATGWADTTRIAAADPELWTAIFSQNKQAVSETLAGLIEQLTKLQTELNEENWTQIHDTLQQAKRIRDALGN
ncbi:MAG: prephenate dehydrogenase/arogenate dehydrogenase family protein [Planctomycetes bacterium]|nr:prephenate dehydrogenase/arogenate dehydrogenase family protein [Planctomycetota bacterium]